MPFNIAGAYAPILSPYSADLKSLDLDEFRAHLAFLKRGGLTGALVLGTNGEFGQLSINEKMALVKEATSTGDGFKIIAGATVPDSPTGTLDFANKLAALENPPDALLVAPPYYDRYAAGDRPQIGEIVEFFHQLADVQNRVPIMLYNVPVQSSGPVTAPVTPELVAEIDGHEMIIGVKDSTGELANISAYLAAKEGLQILVGNDHVMADGLAGGAVGSITACANLFPAQVLAVHEANDETTRKIAQGNLRELRLLLEMIPGKMIAVEKFLATELEIFHSPQTVRNSGGELSGEDRRAVLTRFENMASLVSR